jgi:DNA repair protein RadA/Sms
MLEAGKDRFGAEGESAWFEMGSTGLAEIDPSDLLVTASPLPGAAVVLPRAGRRALAVEVQALVVPGEGTGRRQATGLDARRFQMVAAVIDRVCGLSLGRAELFGASAGGMRVDDPACDLGVAAALVSAATGVAPPEGAAFVGEVSLTGQVRPASGVPQRLMAARSAGCQVVLVPAPSPAERPQGLNVVPVDDLASALTWARTPEAAVAARGSLHPRT